MKITIVQGAFLPIPPVLGGGVEKRWYSLAKEFVKKGHEVDYISKLHEGVCSLGNDDGINHIRVKGFKTPSSGVVLKFYDLLYTLRVLRHISKKTNIIVSNTFWLPIFLTKGQKSKCMIDVARMPKGQMKFYTANSRLRANSNPVAKAIKVEISEKYFEKVIMIPNFLPYKNMQAIDFSKKEKKIVFVGRVHPEKGLDILIKSFVALHTKEWELVIVGPYKTESGGGGEHYLNELKKMVCGNNVSFVGPFFDSEKLNDIYMKASVFVYPSVAEKGETFGISPLEAMSSGCATIVSDLMCFKDFLIHNENGLCFDHRSPNNVEVLKGVLENLINNPYLMHSLGEKALSINQSHSCEKLAAVFLNEFELMQTNT